jgi:hypothetical protein
MFSRNFAGAARAGASLLKPRTNFALNTPMMSQARLFGSSGLYSGTIVAPLNYQKVIPGK